jgi:hypothetical protein
LAVSVLILPILSCIFSSLFFYPDAAAGIYEMASSNVVFAHFISLFRAAVAGDFHLVRITIASRLQFQRERYRLTKPHLEANGI